VPDFSAKTKELQKGCENCLLFVNSMKLGIWSMRILDPLRSLRAKNIQRSKEGSNICERKRFMNPNALEIEPYKVVGPTPATQLQWIHQHSQTVFMKQRLNQIFFRRNRIRIWCRCPIEPDFGATHLFKSLSYHPKPIFHALKIDLV